MKRAARLEQAQTATNTTVPIVCAILAFGFLYAVLGVRDEAAGPMADFSLVSLNKGISLSASILLSCGFIFAPLAHLGVRLPQSWINARKALGMTGFLLVLVHALVSFLLFNPSEYEAFFNQNGSMTTLAGISMLCGVVALVVLSAHNLSFHTFLREDRRFDRLITSPKFLRVALMLAAAHLAVLNFESWLAPAGWPGGMPPVSLLAFVVFVLGISINLLGNE